MQTGRLSGTCVRIPVMTGIRGVTGWVGVVLNAPDARALAYFYRDLFGWSLAADEPDWCTMRLRDAHGAPVRLVGRKRPAKQVSVEVGQGTCVRSIQHNAHPASHPSYARHDRDPHTCARQPPCLHEGVRSRAMRVRSVQVDRGPDRIRECGFLFCQQEAQLTPECTDGHGDD